MSGTENLYYQVFGRIPEQDCPPEFHELLARQINLLPHGEAVLYFTGMCRQRQNYGTAGLSKVASGLREIRDLISADIQLLYGEVVEPEEYFRHLVEQNLELKYEQKHLRQEIRSLQLNTKPNETKVKEEFLERPVAFLSVDFATKNRLKRADIHKIGELIRYTPFELARKRGLGIGTAEAVAHALKQLGFSLASV